MGSSTASDFGGNTLNEVPGKHALPQAAFVIDVFALVPFFVHFFGDHDHLPSTKRQIILVARVVVVFPLHF
jgi:hypothetical protein